MLVNMMQWQQHTIAVVQFVVFKPRTQLAFLNSWFPHLKVYGTFEMVFN